MIDNTPAPRDSAGRFLPGRSGNPVGRPKGETFSRRSVIDRCNELGYHPIDEMIKLARDPKATPYIQLEVAKEITSYMIPKVKQVQITNAEGDGDGMIRISWDTQGVETVKEIREPADMRQFNQDMATASQAILDGVAESVLDDGDDQG